MTLTCSLFSESSLGSHNTQCSAFQCEGRDKSAGWVQMFGRLQTEMSGPQWNRLQKNAHGSPFVPSTTWTPTTEIEILFKYADEYFEFVFLLLQISLKWVYLAKLMANNGSWMLSISRCCAMIDCIFMRLLVVACCWWMVSAGDPSWLHSRDCTDSRNSVYKLFLSASATHQMLIK